MGYNIYVPPTLQSLSWPSGKEPSNNVGKYLYSDTGGNIIWRTVSLGSFSIMSLSPYLYWNFTNANNVTGFVDNNTAITNYVDVSGNNRVPVSTYLNFIKACPFNQTNALAFGASSGARYPYTAFPSASTPWIYCMVGYFGCATAGMNPCLLCMNGGVLSVDMLQEAKQSN